MARNIIKYLGLTLVIIGIVLVMKNLFTSDSDWQTDSNSTKKNKGGTYNASVSLIDQETESYLSGASLVIKDENGNIVDEWTTDTGVHLVGNLKNGNYTLTENQAPEGYHLNEDGVSFTIKDSDQKVTMYNIAMTEEEIKMAQTTNGNGNATSDEVGVENTSSMKNIFLSIGGIFSIIIGSILVLFPKVRKLENM